MYDKANINVIHEAEIHTLIDSNFSVCLTASCLVSSRVQELLDGLPWHFLLLSFVIIYYLFSLFIIIIIINHGSQRINPDDFWNSSTFPLAPKWGRIDIHGICLKHNHGPQGMHSNFIFASFVSSSNNILASTWWIDTKFSFMVSRWCILKTVNDSHLNTFGFDASLWGDFIKISWQLLDGLQCHFVQTFIVPRRWTSRFWFLGDFVNKWKKKPQTCILFLEMFFYFSIFTLSWRFIDWFF